MQHGTESFYIEGEGLVDTSLSGRSGHDPDRVDDPEAPQPSLAEGEPPPFRFSRLGPTGRQLSETNRLKIASAMIKAGKDPGDIPAGFTYLGQFVDHDLTSDRTKVELGDHVSPGSSSRAGHRAWTLTRCTARARSTRSRAFLLRRHAPEGGADPGGGARRRLRPSRVGTGTDRQARKANIPDLRNDENLAVAQTHAAFIRFHNRVVDRLEGRLPENLRFQRARRKVVKHYQWMLRTDFLPRIIDPSVVDDVFANGRRMVEPDATPMDVPTMPVEFSVAAYRSVTAWCD